MIDWSVLLRPSFWLASQPGAMQPLARWVLLGIFVFCVVAALVSAWLSSRTADSLTGRWYAKVAQMFGGLGAFGLVLWFFIWQLIPYLSSRYWLAVWLLAAMIWKTRLFYFWFVIMPVRRQAIVAEQMQKQYLPNRQK
ncbi:MAG: hypothetical protein AAB817_00860 [Patescibacteria group bacterium]